VTGWGIVHLLNEVQAFLFLLTGNKDGAFGSFGFARLIKLAAEVISVS
jgi:hypothetical protein